MKSTLMVAVALLLTARAYAQLATVESSPLAQPYIDVQAGLTLAEALAGALQREPSLRAARAELEAARAMREQADLWANPSLTFERREEPGGTDNQTTLQVSMALELFRRSSRRAIAERELEVVDRSVAGRIRTVVYEIKIRYGQAAAAAREVAVAANLSASARRDLELVRGRVEEGGSPPLDRDRLTVEVHRLDAARLQAAGRAEAAMVELKRSLGLSSESPVKLKETLEVLAPLPPAGETQDLQQRPDVREADARVQLAQARIADAEAEGRLDLELFGSYMRMDAGFPQRGFGPDGALERVRGLFHYASAGAMVTVPLWNRNQGAIAAARAGHAAASARFEAAQIAAQTEVAAASARAAYAKQALGAIAEGVILAQKNLDVVRQTYALGRGSLTDVLLEQRQYLDVEIAYTAALQAAFEARISLEFARGGVK